MTNWTDRLLLEVVEPDRAASPIVPLSPAVPEPIWRYRRPMKATGISISLRKEVLTQVGFSLRSMFANSCGLPEGGSTLEVQQFVLLTLGSDEAAALLHVETLISQGTTPELIFLNLLAPTARRLSEMCDSDAIDSVTVTLAICRLQEIVRHLGDAFPVNNRGIGGEVLLTTIPGNQLSLEMTMVAELFYRDGWAVRSMPFRPLGDLFSLIGECWFEVIGLWVTSDRRPDELKRYIQDVRRRSRNPKVGIMLGGPTLTRRPDLSASVGADVAAAEGDSAPRLARELVAALKAGK